MKANLERPVVWICIHSAKFWHQSFYKYTHSMVISHVQIGTVTFFSGFLLWSFWDDLTNSCAYRLFIVCFFATPYVFQRMCCILYRSFFSVHNYHFLHKTIRGIDRLHSKTYVDRCVYLHTIEIINIRTNFTPFTSGVHPLITLEFNRPTSFIVQLSNENRTFMHHLYFFFVEPIKKLIR